MTNLILIKTVKMFNFINLNLLITSKKITHKIFLIKIYYHE